MANKGLSREEIARKEIGITQVSRGLALGLTLLFLSAVFIVPAIQIYLNDRKDRAFTEFLPGAAKQDSKNLFESINRVNKQILKGIDQLETDLEEQSFLRDLFLPPLQYLYTRYGGKGNEKVVVGKSDWLFYRPGVDYLMGPPFLDGDQLDKRIESKEIWEDSVQPDPVAAIVDFAKQLTLRGITLVVVPVPVKASLHPRLLSERKADGAVVNRSLTDFFIRLGEEGIFCFDPRPTLHNYSKSHDFAYLKTDTHWLPGAMEHVAKDLMKFIEKNGLLEASSEGDALDLYELKEENLEGDGDISRMLVLPEGVDLYGMQQITVHQVLNSEGEYWQPNKEAEVLLLGDSFTNIYSTPGLGWGRGAGFAEHLSFNLQRPLDLLARNDSGAYVTREMLSQELARGRDRLAGKKIVIWEFSERELAFGNWKEISLEVGGEVESDFLVVDAGSQMQVTARVAAVSRSPRPGSVPYRDNIITMHLVDVQSGKDVINGQVLVYGFGMRDNELTPLASIRPDDMVTLSLSSWEEVEQEYGSYRRSPLDDEMMELELPNWGEIYDENTN